MRSPFLGGLRGSLLRYKIMAFTVGVGLLVLVLIGVPLQYAAGRPGVVEVVGPIHGVLYIVYLVAAFDLACRARFKISRMILMLAAGLLPFLAFYIEHKVAKQIETAIRLSPPRASREAKSTRPREDATRA